MHLYDIGKDHEKSMRLISNVRLIVGCALIITRVYGIIAGVGKWEPMSQLWLLPRLLVALWLSSDKVLICNIYVLC